MKTLLLIDANSLLHRAYHALPPLTAKDGSPAGALYGVGKIMNKILREEKPEYVAACFDRPEQTFRAETFQEYKAHRPDTAEELVTQLISAHDLFQALGICTVDEAGFEADDCIATLAYKFAPENDLRIVILTGDRDTLQLVQGDHIVVRAPRKGISDAKIYDEKAILEEYNLTPKQIVDYKALAGDPSDNIKGVAGIGPKGAVALLSKYPTLEEILAHPEDPATSKVIHQQKAAEQSKYLVTLRSDVPLKIGTLEDLNVRENDLHREAYFSNLGFKSLVSGMENTFANKGGKDAPSPSQGAMF